MDERERGDREQRERRAEGLRRRIAGLTGGAAGDRPPPRSPHEFIQDRMREEAKRLEEQSADEPEPEEGREGAAGGQAVSHPFDPGPVRRPFARLAAEYPGLEAYPAADFRVEWGPVFHRGRLDGSAVVLVLGQDPGQHECIARRILVGEAGQRVQGFLRKLGIERSYVMINAFLYSVFGQQGGERHADSQAIVDYRHRWLDALVRDEHRLQAVVAFGHLAHDAYDRWAAANPGRAGGLAVERLTHPTMPEAASHGDPERRREATRRMLEQWNGALRRLDEALMERDEERELVFYGDDLVPGDRAPIPERDLPAGSPPWMRSLRQWATRRGDTAEEKRACIEVVVPREERPWEPLT